MRMHHQARRRVTAADEATADSMELEGAERQARYRLREFPCLRCLFALPKVAARPEENSAALRRLALEGAPSVLVLPNRVRKQRVLCTNRLGTFPDRQGRDQQTGEARYSSNSSGIKRRQTELDTGL